MPRSGAVSAWARCAAGRVSAAARMLLPKASVPNFALPADFFMGDFFFMSVAPAAAAANACSTRGGFFAEISMFRKGVIQAIHFKGHFGARENPLFPGLHGLD